MGVAFPGMNENLGINRSQFDIPNSVVVNAHADKFELDGTYTIAMSGIAGDLGGNLSGIKGKAAKVQSALTQMGMLPTNWSRAAMSSRPVQMSWQAEQLDSRPAATKL